MVGEIRDLETADIGIHAALTGHLVFSTLHERRGRGPTSSTWAWSRTWSPPCWRSWPSASSGWCARMPQAHEPDVSELRALGIDASPRPRGSRAGRVRRLSRHGVPGPHRIYEFMGMTEELRSLAIRKTPGHEIRQRAIAGGMTTLRQDGWQKCCLGVTTVEEVLRVTHEDMEA